MKHTLSFLTGLFAALPALHAGLQLLTGFHTETKIKGGFAEHAGRFYFTAEKGGDHSYGYIGQLNPADGEITVVHSFTTDAKPKGGLVRVGDQFYLQGEKGSLTTGFGWVARFNPTNGEFIETHGFAGDVKPKSGLVHAAGSLWFATEKGGVGSGSIERFDPARQTLTTTAPLTFETGIKIESLVVTADGSAVFAGAREGGDAAELAGKGAGTLLRVDTATGALTRLTAFKAAEHGAKLRGLTLHGDRLWFVMEEGGDLALNSGKGGGTIASFDLTTGTVSRKHQFDGAVTGFKPKAFARAGGDFYFATEAGGVGGLGVFGVLRGGTSVESLAEFSAESSAKPDHYLSVIGGRVVFSTELGGPGYLGGILSYSLPAAPVPPPTVKIEQLNHGDLRVSWPDPDDAFVLQTVSALGSTAWADVSSIPERTESTASVEVDPDAGTAFFRLRSRE